MLKIGGEIENMKYTMTKVCTGDPSCGIEQSVDNFYKNGYKYFSRCKSCISKLNHKSYVKVEKYRTCSVCKIRVKTSNNYLHFDIDSKGRFLQYCKDDNCKKAYNMKHHRELKMFKLRARFRLWCINGGEFI